MKKACIFIFILSVSLLAVPFNSAVFAQKVGKNRLQSIADSVKTAVNSDKRIGLYDVTVSESGKKYTFSGEVSHPLFLQVLKARIEREDLSKKAEFNVTVLPGPKLGQNTWGIINRDVVKIHREPKHKTEQVTQALLGETVHILKQNESWLYVQLAEDGYLGWIPADTIIRCEERKAAHWKSGPQVIVTSLHSVVYDNTAVHQNVLRKPTVGTVLPLLETWAYWNKVLLPDGMIGWIPAGDVKPFSFTGPVTPPSPEQIIGTAVRFLGIDYLWGGRSSYGCDCSGFVQTVFKLNGVKLLRDANMQALTGELIEPDEGLGNLKMGDLLFFGKNRVTHVGIYINDGFFIHSSDWVRINNLKADKDGYNPRRRKTLLHARRILR